MSGVLFLAEVENGNLKSYSKELAGVALGLSKEIGSEAIGLVIGKNVAMAGEVLGEVGIAKVFAAQGEGLDPYRGEAHFKALREVVAKTNPQIVLASASSDGKDLLPRLAMKLKAGLATDCVALSIDGGKLKCRRPIFAGKALADVTFESDVQLATVRPNAFGAPKTEAGKKAVVETLAIDVGNLPVTVKEVTESEVGMKDLSEAEVIISGGRALGSADNFKIIRECAEILGATVGASRAAVDAGYISHDHQVGQTGKTVNPKLYIACGISGAIQHLAGMRTSKVIVAINKDAEAPIFSKADYGIVGDLFQVVPALTEALKKVLK